MPQNNFISMCANGQCSDAVKAYVDEKCVRKNCPNQDGMPSCAGCLKQHIIFNSLYSHSPEIKKALEALEEWQLNQEKIAPH